MIPSNININVPVMYTFQSTVISQTSVIVERQNQLKTVSVLFVVTNSKVSLMIV